MNPIEMMKIAGELRKFRETHPKVAQFLQTMIQSGIPEGTVIEMTVTKPGEQAVSSNMRVQPSDLTAFETLRGMQRR